MIVTKTYLKKCTLLRTLTIVRFPLGISYRNIAKEVVEQKTFDFQPNYESKPCWSHFQHVGSPMVSS